MNDNSPSVFLIAGEASGDALGAGLMAALTAKTDAQVRFQGVGGEGMAAQGLDSLFPMTDLSVMGAFEVLPRLPLLLRRISETVAAIKAAKPDVIVTIDAPDFVFRVAKKLKASGLKTPIIHYVAPSVWAWRAGRAAKIAKFLDHVLCLLPFEPPYFEREGLAATCVGHPVVESGLDLGDGAAFRARHDIAKDATQLCVLPGSRQGEIDRHLPIFKDTVAALQQSHPDLVCVVPSVPHLADQVEAAVAAWPVSAIVTSSIEKADAFAASNAAIAASGTVTLELALARVPAVVAYKMNPLTSWLAKRLIRVRFASLINIILEREAVPEFLLENCRADLIAPAVEHLLSAPGVAEAQIADADRALVELGQGGPSPSDRAAQAVLKVIKENMS